MTTLKGFHIRNYFKLHFFAFLYALLGVPILLNASSYFPVIDRWLAVIIFVPIVVPLLTEIFWSRVAQENPYAYFKTLKLKLHVSKIFWILVCTFWLSLLSLELSLYIKNITTLLLSFFAFAITLEMVLGIAGFQALLTIAEIPTMYNRKTLLRTNAKVCFFVIASGNKLENNFSNFKLGIDYVNSYMNVKFKLELLKLQYYYNFFKLIAFSRNEEEKDRIRKALNDFAHRLDGEMDLTDIILTTRNIIGKPIFRFEDVYEELEFDVSIQKKISKHKELITFLVLVFGAFLTVVQTAPIVYNALHHTSNPNMIHFFMIFISSFK